MDYRLDLPSEFDDRAEEWCLKGYYGGASVVLPTGQSVSVFFYDPVRLAQDLETSMEYGDPCLYEQRMIVVPRITREAMMEAVDWIAHNGGFDPVRPVEPFARASDQRFLAGEKVAGLRHQEQRIPFHDLDSDDEGFLFVREFPGAVALCLTLRKTFDAEVSVRPSEAREFARALLLAADAAEHAPGRGEAPDRS